MTEKVRATRIQEPATRRALRSRLLGWYDRHRRDLPWRGDRDPYHVWLSEIMLQQTRVAAAADYYQRFIHRFPTIQALARARLSSVLAAWSGLGYYRRARALRQAARQIVGEHNGNFPATAAELRTLPGIGRYTAAAIASIAFGEPVAVVDGNVERVLQRLAGRTLAREQQWGLAVTVLSRKRPGDFNQALMELGATVCLPRGPKCLTCPLAGMCATRGELALTPAKLRRKHVVHYAFDASDGAIFLVQRPGTLSLMPGMWELPELGEANGQHEPYLTLRHSITATDYTVQVLRGAAPEGVVGRRVPASRLSALPLTGLTRKILRAAKVI